MPNMMDREFFDWYWQLPPLGGKQNKSLEDTMNKITLIGHLGRDPEMRYTPTGQAVTSFSVATSYGQGDKKQTEWFNCSAWEKQAELCNQYLQKGSLVAIEGRDKARSYEGRDGWQASLDVAVSYVEFLGSSQGSAAKATNAPASSAEVRAEMEAHVSGGAGGAAPTWVPPWEEPEQPALQDMGGDIEQVAH